MSVRVNNVEFGVRFHRPVENVAVIDGVAHDVVFDASAKLASEMGAHPVAFHSNDLTVSDDGTVHDNSDNLAIIENLSKNAIKNIRKRWNRLTKNGVTAMREQFANPCSIFHGMSFHYNGRRITEGTIVLVGEPTYGTNYAHSVHEERYCNAYPHRADQTRKLNQARSHFVPRDFHGNPVLDASAFGVKSTGTFLDTAALNYTSNDVMSDMAALGVVFVDMTRSDDLIRAMLDHSAKVLAARKPKDVHGAQIIADGKIIDADDFNFATVDPSTPVCIVASDTAAGYVDRALTAATTTIIAVANGNTKAKIARMFDRSSTEIANITDARDEFTSTLTPKEMFILKNLGDYKDGLIHLYRDIESVDDILDSLHEVTYHISRKGPKYLTTDEYHIVNRFLGMVGESVDPGNLPAPSKYAPHLSTARDHCDMPKIVDLVERYAHARSEKVVERGIPTAADILTFITDRDDFLTYLETR